MRRTAIAAALVLAAGSAAGQELPRSPITFVHDAQFDAGCEAFPNLLELGTECGGPTGRYAAEEDRGGGYGLVEGSPDGARVRVAGRAVPRRGGAGGSAGAALLDS